MELVDLLRSVRRQWRLAVGIMLAAVAVLAAFLVTRNEVRPDDRYEAKVQLLVPARDEDGLRPEGVPPQLLQGQSTIALSSQTKNAAFDAAEVPEEQRRSISFGFSTSESGDILTLSAAAPTPELATSVANAFADAFANRRRDTVSSLATSSANSARSSLATVTQRRSEVRDQLAAIDPDLPGQVSGQSTTNEDGSAAALDLPSSLSNDEVLLAYEFRRLDGQINSLRQQYADAQASSLTPQSFSTVVERFSPVQITPELPSPLVPTAVILGAGLLLAIGAPVLLDRLDRSVRDARAASVAFGAPVLSSIPLGEPGDEGIATPGTPRDGAFRALAATSVATDRLPRAIVVTAPRGDVQDEVAANFAAALASLGLRVTLIATHPRQAWFLQQPPGSEDRFATLQDLLARAHAGRVNGDLPARLATTHLPNLSVLPAPAEGTELTLDGLAPLLDAFATAGVDVTVIAAPGLLEDPDATILAWTTRSVLWVVEAGGVTEADAREAAARATLAGVTPLGVAIVDGSA